MDFGKLQDTLGVFWGFTSAYLTVTVICVLITIYYIAFQNRYAYLKAKDPFNLVIIFIAGQFQSWGHYMYSLPVYLKEPNAIVTCLVVGYVLQHLLGTTLLFYALVNRLIKFGMIFRSFNCFGRADVLLTWTKLSYIKRLNIRYRIAILLSFVIVLAPICIFILSVYKFKSLTVNDEMYCVTDSRWKITFIIINTCYFLLLGVLTCFVPRKIEGDNFNEAGQLVQSIVYAIVVFIIEIWIGFGSEDTSLTWGMISNGMVFSIHVFVIFRIFGYRAYKAISGDINYSDRFKKGVRMQHYKPKYFKEIVLNPDVNNSIVANFLAYMQIKFQSSEITLTSPMSTESKTVSILNAVTFVRKALTFESRMRCELTEHQRVVQFAEFKSILSDYITNNILPFSDLEVAHFERITKETLSYSVFQKCTRDYMVKFYYEYFNSYIKTEEASKLDDEIRESNEVKLGMNEMIGTIEVDEDDYEMQLLAGSLIDRAKAKH